MFTGTGCASQVRRLLSTKDTQGALAGLGMLSRAAVRQIVPDAKLDSSDHPLSPNRQHSAR